MDLPWTASYAVSKAALIRFAGSMQADYNDTGLRFYSTHPGSVHSKISLVENVTTQIVRDTKPEIPRFIETTLADFLDATAELSAFTCCFLFSSKVYLFGRALTLGNPITRKVH
jgi:NAD(P)-dependent dehydrogenase (short-subunit alcohol dehydrogenase family)